MKTTSILLAVAVVLSACAPGKKEDAPAKAAPPDMHTSRNSLDWAGVYAGVLPCADCPGIDTRLTLGNDGTFELVARYLERPAAPRTERGKFTWQPGGNAITLDANGGGQQFAVGEGRLTLLDRDGARPGPQAPNRVLKLVPGKADAGGGLLKTLEAHRWTLESATDAGNRRDDVLSPGGGRAFVFTFSGSAMNVSGGCNSLRGSYEINAEGKLQVGSMASTMMACEPALMKADTAMSALLAKPMRIDVLPGPQPQLRLVAASNETLTLTGQMTPEARYGPANLVFLEVAARQVKCNAPSGGETMCLQVRERQFDQQGLAVGTPGAFQPFFGSIEGFKHTPGVRTVLRVKRFQRSPVPGDASPSLYVLDLVVESATVTQ